MSPDYIAWYWAAVPLALAALGAILLLRGAYHFLGRRRGRAAAHAAAGLPLAVAGLAAGLVALNAQDFVRLGPERAVANVAVQSLGGGGAWRITVQRLDIPGKIQQCDIRGGEWTMGAAAQRWKPWAAMLGLDITYTLDRMTGTSGGAPDAGDATAAACDLEGSPPALNGYVPRSWLSWLLGRAYVRERPYGSAAAMPNADGAVYKVTMTGSGLDAEPINPAASAAASARR
ncbi:MAG TPA: hypothetical protein VG819_09480 [Rhizomicrobium sp.]|nr:hypothetical protein [Rhizomicrobium sp.]